LTPTPSSTGSLSDGKWSLIDFNRSGVPLLEIVTEPCVHTADAAKEYLEKLRGLVRWIGIADADMEEGSMRCEPNINLEIEDEGKLFYTPIVEVKNINSFNFVKKAIDYEVQRQFDEFVQTRLVLVKGNKQTRGWNASKNITVLQRTKEEADDYRYFPEPDIPPFQFSEKENTKNPSQRLVDLWSKIIKLGTPWETMLRLVNSYGLSDYQAQLIIQDRGTVEYFEKVIGEMKELGGLDGLGGKEIANAIINKKIAISFKPKEFISELVKQLTKVEVSEDRIKEQVLAILKDNPSVVESYKKGREQVLGVVVGLVKKQTGAIVDFQTIKTIIDDNELK